MPRKKLKVSHDLSYSADFCFRSTSVVLSDLPNEILIKILKYLTAVELARISTLKIQRLMELNLNSRFADFSECNSIHPTDVPSFFIKERLNSIQEINFNNIFNVLPSTLTSCITKCKNITKLYVFDCGLTYFHIIDILKNCRALEEIYWSFPDIVDNYLKCQKPGAISISVKKLWLQAKCEKPNYLTIHRLIEMCPYVEDIYLNYTTCYVTSIPAHLSTTNVCFKFMLKQINIPLHVILNCPAQVPPFRLDLFMTNSNLLECCLDHRELFNIDIRHTHLHLTYHSSFLQFVAAEEFLDELPQLPNESVRSLVIIMNRKIEDISNHTSRILKMTGNALEHLALYEYLRKGNSFSDENSLSICDLLSTITDNCTNITVLSLPELHLKCTLPFSSLCALKGLKVLNLTACCLTDVETVQPQDDYEFKNFVINCSKVEEFGIYGWTYQTEIKKRFNLISELQHLFSYCNKTYFIRNCNLGPSDEKLVSISLWQGLKYLTLKRVTSVRRCHFFTNIANTCPKLKSLEIFCLSEPTVCHFIPSIVHILKKSTNLTFLRINQPGFYPKEPMFWSSVKCAQNLQGLCLATEVSTPIENKLILLALKELPRLHLFHLLAKRTCRNFTSQIKQMMISNGVKHHNIFIGPSHNNCYEMCPRRHLAI